jgi:TetR/AcrR family transcriptional regulator, cholesterol catabolism regulator
MSQAATPKAAGTKVSGRREELLNVAARVFARKGFANATVRDIGEEAGILSGSLYHHFESKDAILENLLVNLYDEMERGYRAVLDRGLPADETVVELVACGFSYLDQLTDPIHVLNNDFVYISHVPRFRFVAERNRRIESMWTEALERGVDDGVFRPDLDPQFTFRIMMGSLDAAVQWVDPNGPLPAEQLGRRAAELFIRGLRSG